MKNFSIRHYTKMGIVVLMMVTHGCSFASDDADEDRYVNYKPLTLPPLLPVSDNKTRAEAQLICVLDVLQAMYRPEVVLYQGFSYIKMPSVEKGIYGFECGKCHHFTLFEKAMQKHVTFHRSAK